jgi:RNA exonuclease 1
MKGNGPCKYHSEELKGSRYTCCHKTTWDGPCKTAKEHERIIYAPGEMEEYHKSYATPSEKKQNHRLAVAFDCEMGTSVTNESLLIRISAVDYVTSEILIDDIVVPEERLAHLNTAFSGVTKEQYNKAQNDGTALLGKSAARQKLWNFVGPDTIVVVHGGASDFKSLRWRPSNVIDTCLVESIPVKLLRKERMDQMLAEEMRKASKDRDEALSSLSNKKIKRNQRHLYNEIPGQFKLKTLTLKRVGRVIQPKKTGHDSVEDAIATRDVAHWNVLNYGHGVYEV